MQSTPGEVPILHVPIYTSQGRAENIKFNFLKFKHPKELPTYLHTYRVGTYSTYLYIYRYCEYIPRVYSTLLYGVPRWVDTKVLTYLLSTTVE